MNRIHRTKNIIITSLLKIKYKILPLIISLVGIYIGASELKRLEESIDQNSLTLEGNFSPLINIKENLSLSKKDKTEVEVYHTIQIKNSGNSTAHNIKIFYIEPSDKWNLNSLTPYTSDFLSKLKTTKFQLEFIEDKRELIEKGKLSINENIDLLKTPMILNENEEHELLSWKLRLKTKPETNVESLLINPRIFLLKHNISIVISYCDLLGACYLADAFRPHLRVRYGKGNKEESRNVPIFGKLDESNKIINEISDNHWEYSSFNKEKIRDIHRPFLAASIEMFAKIDEMYHAFSIGGLWINERADNYSLTETNLSKELTSADTASLCPYYDRTITSATVLLKSAIKLKHKKDIGLFDLDLKRRISDIELMAYELERTINFFEETCIKNFSKETIKLREASLDTHKKMITELKKTKKSL
ncbi:hypothetical protein [Gilvimarinus sp. 1_MG-2023]|uniref:hypothetical protein n=1 Tax=Gilvimarinus sp. 1_MG-2023 TaxID=3062638 RepID=UPI0026E11838|nr:hypothetical protein [Gilvimarinus sp. 1_MG-2023]MDO6748535.1 hypothetical protein [Gilvimarinus sp. 1_MG-2023]